MRRCFCLAVVLAILIAGIVPITALAAAKRHGRHYHHEEARREQTARRAPAARLRSAAAELKPHRARKHRHARPHTAQAIHHARRHGTEAVRAAARQAAMEAAEEQTTEDAPRQTASLSLPATPLHYVNLPPLRGSHESLVRQNERAEQEGLLRIQDDADIANLRRIGALVSIPTGEGLRVDEKLPANRRYCRQWTERFLTDLARAHYNRFHDGLQVNSAVRTVEYQRRLLRINGNAAPAEGDIASPHLTGATIDIAKKGLRPAEVSWLRAYLYPLQTGGKLDVEEEFHQSCFHITVYKNYDGAVDPGTPWPASAHRRVTLLASRAR
jgi:hypothetical protein